MKINKLVCPRCIQECWTECAYTTCDACGTFFYASQQFYRVQVPAITYGATRVYINGIEQPFVPLRWP